MSAPAIGPRRYVAPLDVRVVEFGRTAAGAIVHDYQGAVAMWTAAQLREHAAHCLAAAEQVEAIQRAGREAETAQRARLAVLERMPKCRGCSDPLDPKALYQDGLCGLCANDRDRAQRIVGPAGEVAL